MKGGQGHTGIKGVQVSSSSGFLRPEAPDSRTHGRHQSLACAELTREYGEGGSR